MVFRMNLAIFIKILVLNSFFSFSRGQSDVRAIKNTLKSMSPEKVEVYSIANDNTMEFVIPIQATKGEGLRFIKRSST